MQGGGPRVAGTAGRSAEPPSQARLDFRKEMAALHRCLLLSSLLLPFPSVLVSWGCRNSHKRGGFNSTHLLSRSSRGRRSQIRVSAGLVPSEGCEGASSTPPPGSRWFAGNCWRSLACWPIAPSLTSCSHGFLPVCRSVSKSPLFTRTPVILRLGVHPTSMTSS